MIDKHGNELDPSEVEEDKKRWFKAWKMIRDNSYPEIRQWLIDQPEDYREDMRRRFNELAKTVKRR